MYRATTYLYKRKRLHAYNKKVELSLGNDAIENYGFKHIRRMLPFNYSLQALRLSGNYNEYFTCNEKRLGKIEGMLKQLPVQRTEFFEV